MKKYTSLFMSFLLLLIPLVTAENLKYKYQNNPLSYSTSCLQGYCWQSPYEELSLMWDDNDSSLVYPIFPSENNFLNLTYPVPFHLSKLNTSYFYVNYEGTKKNFSLPEDCLYTGEEHYPYLIIRVLNDANWGGHTSNVYCLNQESESFHTMYESHCDFGNCDYFKGDINEMGTWFYYDDVPTQKERVVSMNEALVDYMIKIGISLGVAGAALATIGAGGTATITIGSGIIIIVSVAVAAMWTIEFLKLVMNDKS